MKQHKWHKEIKAWADGAEIESKDDECAWAIDDSPYWESKGFEYRIKPQPKEPQYLYVWLDKVTEETVGYLENPVGSILEDKHLKYVGKIKLEQDND